MGNKSNKPRKKFDDDKREKITYENGDKYNGHLLENKKSGRGDMTFANGERFHGLWLLDKKHGLG